MTITKELPLFSGERAGFKKVLNTYPTCWIFPDVPRSERFAIVCLSLGIPDVLDVPRRASLRTICNRLSFTGDFQSPYIPYTLYTNNLMLPINYWCIGCRGCMVLIFWWWLPSYTNGNLSGALNY